MLIMLEFSDLINLEKIVTNTGVYSPILIYMIFIYLDASLLPIILLIISILISILFIVSIQLLKSDIERDKGTEFLKKMSKWRAKPLLIKTAVIYLTLTNLIVAFLISLMYTIDNIEQIKEIPILLIFILTIISGATILYKVIFIVFFGWKRIKYSIKEIKGL